MEMTLTQKIQLIDDLIAENPDVMIKDYWKAVQGESNKMLTLLIFESSMNQKAKRNVSGEIKKYYQTFHIRR